MVSIGLDDIAPVTKTWKMLKMLFSLCWFSEHFTALKGRRRQGT